MSKKQDSINEKKTGVESALREIQAKYGEGAIMRLGDARAQRKIEVIPTGGLAIDLALGVGGVPPCLRVPAVAVEGDREVQVFGHESAFRNASG